MAMRAAILHVTVHVPTHACTCVHRCTHTHGSVHTHYTTHARTCVHKCTHARTQVCSHSLYHIHMHMCTHVGLGTLHHTHVHTCTQIYTCAHGSVHTHHTCVHMCTQIHTCTHGSVHTHYTIPHAHLYTDTHMPAYPRAHITVPTCTIHTDAHPHTSTHTHAHNTCAQRHAHDICTIYAHTSAYTSALAHTPVCTHRCTPICTHVLTHTEFTGREDLTSIPCCPGHSHRLRIALPTEALAPPCPCPAVHPPHTGPRDLLKPNSPVAAPAVPASLGVKGEVLTILKDAQHPITAAMLMSCFSHTPGRSCPTSVEWQSLEILSVVTPGGAALDTGSSANPATGHRIAPTTQNSQPQMSVMWRWRVLGPGTHLPQDLGTCSSHCLESSSPKHVQGSLLPVI